MSSCPHAQTTTLQWIWGEGPEDHLRHLASCAECQQVLEDHERVLAAVAGVSELEDSGVAGPTLGAARRVGPQRRAVLIASAVALAAAVLLVFRPPDVVGPEEPLAPDTGTGVPITALDGEGLFADSLDDDLASLDLALSWMAVELEPGQPLEEP